MTDPAGPPDPPTTPANPSVLRSIERSGRTAPKVLLPVDDESSSLLIKPSGRNPDLEKTSGEKYRVLGELARGGVGSVLKGHDVDLGRDVAMKVLLEEYADNESVMQRFVEEAQIGGQLQHPGIVPVYEMGLLADERPYFTMKLIKGRTLQELLSDRDSPQTDRRRFLSIFEQVCQTMAYAHSRRVIHRDLKPANIMVGAFGEVQVVDWGFAKVLNRGGVADERRARRQQTKVSLIETVRSKPGSSGSESVAGSILGTPAYMPPEQARGDVDELDERADVFSLGAILCEILTGQAPYVGANGEEVLIQAANAQLKEARERLEQCNADETVVQLALRCLNPAPVTRPRNAEAVATEISEHLASVEERAQQAQVAAAELRVQQAASRQAHRLTLALAAAVVVILAGGGGAWVWVDHQRQARREVARNTVSASLERARELRQDAHDSGDLELYGAALNALEPARRVLADDAPDPDSRQRVEDLEATLREERQSLQVRQASERRDRQVLDRLEAIFAEVSSRFGEADDPNEVADRAFADAFRDYGLDFEAMSLDDACATIADVPLAIELAPSLDEWSFMRRQTSKEWKATTRHTWQDLLSIAQAADPDEARNEVRHVVQEEDLEGILEIARSPGGYDVSPRTTLLLCKAMRELGDTDAALALARRTQVQNADDYRANVSLGYFLGLADAPPAERARAFGAALALRPESLMARRRLVDALLGTREYDTAGLVLDEGLRRKPDDVEFHFLRGFVHVRLGEVEQSIEQNLEATRLDPDRAMAWMNLGIGLGLLGRHEEARAALEEAVRLKPSESTTHTVLGNTLMFLGDTAAAERELRRSQDSIARLTLAYAIRDRSPQEFERELAFALRSARFEADASKSFDVLANWALTLAMMPVERLRDAHKARTIARDGLLVYPGESNLLTAMAIACEGTGEWREVLEARRGIELSGGEDPPVGVADFCAAIAAWNLGEQERARRFFDAGVEWLEGGRSQNWVHERQAEEYRERAAAVMGG